MANHGKPAARLLWGRSLIASLLAEVVLAVITVALFSALADPTGTLDLVIPAASLLVFIPAGYWTARAAPGRALINGALTGLWGIALYIALTLVMRGAVADFDFESSLRPAYMLAHGLKAVGGAIGGWLLLRKLEG